MTQRRQGISGTERRTTHRASLPWTEPWGSNSASWRGWRSAIAVFDTGSAVGGTNSCSDGEEREDQAALIFMYASSLAAQRRFVESHQVSCIAWAGEERSSTRRANKQSLLHTCKRLRPSDSTYHGIGTPSL